MLGAAVMTVGLTMVEEPRNVWAALGAGSTLELQVTGVAGVPSDAAAVVLNVTAVQRSGARVRDGVSVRAVTT